jgi:hypothetical protein
VETKPRSKHHVTGTNGTSPDRRAGRGDWRPGPWHGARRGAESNEVLAVGQLLEAIADPTNLVTAWAKVRANAGAAGVDDQSIAAFAADEDHQLVSLRRRLLSAERYVSPPVRRVEIPKPDGRRRPLGIPTVADRVVQQATVQVIARLSRPGSCAVRDGFEFLGFSFHGRFLRPRARALIRFKDEVRRRTRRLAPVPVREMIAELDPVIRGWGHYFKVGDVTSLFEDLDKWIRMRLHCKVIRRHATPLSNAKMPNSVLRRLGLVSPRRSPSCLPVTYLSPARGCRLG